MKSLTPDPCRATVELIERVSCSPRQAFTDDSEPDRSSMKPFLSHTPAAIPGVFAGAALLTFLQPEE